MLSCVERKSRPGPGLDRPSHGPPPNRAIPILTTAIVQTLSGPSHWSKATPLYKIDEVQDPADLRQWHLIRQSVYLAEELLMSSDVGNEVYTDKYDEYSQHFLVKDSSGSGVACARLIIRGDGQPLQVEETFDLAAPPRSAEISGFAVMPKHRTGLASVGLIRALLERLRELEIPDCYAEVEPWFFGALTKFGYPITQISEPRFVYNAENFAFHVSVEEYWRVVTTASQERQASLMGSYYSHPWEWEIGPRHLNHAE